MYYCTTCKLDNTGREHTFDESSVCLLPETKHRRFLGTGVIWKINGQRVSQREYPETLYFYEYME